MLIGKISENVTKRSVLRLIHSNKDKNIVGANLGADCAFFTSQKDEIITVTTAPVTYTVENVGEFAVYRMAANLAASGAEPIGIMVNILMSPEEKEDVLKKVVKQIDEHCTKCNMQVLQVHAEVTEAVSHTLVTVTGIGKQLLQAAELSPSVVHSGQDIVMTKFLGMEGTVLLASERKEELLKRLPKTLIDNAIKMKDELFILPEAVIAIHENASYMHAVTEGGIFAALWNLAERAGVGLKVHMKALPVKQETVEICEYFLCNPYQLMSTGSLLIVTDHGKALVNSLHEKNIPAVIIGKITDNNDRVVVNEDETRFLDLPKPDEIYSVNAIQKNTV